MPAGCIGVKIDVLIESECSLYPIEIYIDLLYLMYSKPKKMLIYNNVIYIQ